MKVVVGEVLPLALVVTISPLNVIPAILLLFSAKPVANACSFLGGFVVGVAAVLVGFVVLAGAIDRSAGSDGSTWTSVLKVALGAYLVVAAVRKFRGRPATGEEGSMPAWMDGIAAYSPMRSLGTGLGLGALNPKNLVVGLAAGATIAAGELSGGQVVASCAVYVAVAVAGVAAPIVVMLLLGERAPAVLERWKDWLRHNSATVMSVLFLAFGVVLIGQGIAGG